MELANPGKRPICASCSKPIRLCLCDRFKHPPIDNAIPLTILRHSHEKNHPLNSTRIVTLGLKNVNVVTVSDVHLQAQFFIRPLRADFSADSLVTNTAGNPSEICSERAEPDCCGLSCDSATSEKGTSFTVANSDGACHLSGVRKSVPEEENGISDCKSPKESSGRLTKILRNPNSQRNIDSQVAHDDLLEVDCERSSSLEPGKSFPGFRVDGGFSSTCDGRVDVEQTEENAERKIYAEETGYDCAAACENGFEHIRCSSTKTRTQRSVERENCCINEEKGEHCRPDMFQPMLPRESPSTSEEDLITATIAKCGFTCTLARLWNCQKHSEEPDFARLSASPVGKRVISDGFIVKKLQRKQIDGTEDIQELEEFEIRISPGSALLFPSEKSVSLENIDFSVKHLIVLDGTWAKAKRMYHENPWLKLLPHLKLDSKEAYNFNSRKQELAKKMFGGDNNSSVFPIFLEGNQFHYDASGSTQLHLFGNATTSCKVDLMNCSNNDPVSASNRPCKRSREPEENSRNKKLQISLHNFCPDEVDQSAGIQPNVVSTGLRLSYDDDERNSSITSASGSMSTLPILSFDDNVRTEIDRQKQEFDHYMKIQEEHIMKGVRDMRHRHMAAFLNVIEKGVGRKVLDKEIQIDNMNRKNRELFEKIKQVAAEAQSWHYRAKYSESVVNVLKNNLKQAIAQGADQTKEGCGDSEVDDAASSFDCDGIPGKLNASQSTRALKDQMTCRACKTKEVCLLLLPCRHLCLCKDCEEFIEVCPMCQCMKTASVQVYMC
ncbi:hypothetical protein H6P81_011705 [Aristolochia fimbriata]|uniref:tRNA-uridine aminocarboxypropyltransferase n=1 Tax=Aristolochia fimbriata TaxID=158543 RepID=A0AAV7ECZ4_ARIFI|nr:hypothetical protein H6P81_011705 [Aristolochia fimbriata]